MIEDEEEYEELIEEISDGVVAIQVNSLQDELLGVIDVDDEPSSIRKNTNPSKLAQNNNTSSPPSKQSSNNHSTLSSKPPVKNTQSTAPNHTNSSAQANHILHYRPMRPPSIRNTMLRTEDINRLTDAMKLPCVVGK